MTASRIVYLNGDFLPFEEARVPIMDRGFLFADGIYEVSAIIEGRLVDNAAHLARLDRSLGEIGIRNPHDAAEWERLQTELVAKQVEKTLLARTTESRQKELSHRRTRNRELRGADAAKTPRKH